MAKIYVQAVETVMADGVFRSCSCVWQQATEFVMLLPQGVCGVFKTA
jgi:hypothetical protein